MPTKTEPRHSLFVSRRQAPVKVVQRADGDLPKIEGYGAVFYREGDPDTEYRLWDDFVERIMPGAFDETLAGDPDVRSLFNHDTNQLLGRTSSGTLELRVDDVGLFYSIDPPDTQVARDLLKSLEREDVDGSSFMFLPTDTVWREQDELFIREIHGVELFEVGPVTFPAYEGTTSGTRQDLRQRIEARKRAMRDKRDRQPPEPPARHLAGADSETPCPGCRQLERRLRGLETRLKLLETA